LEQDIVEGEDEDHGRRNVVEGEDEYHGRRNKMSGSLNRISWKVKLKIMEGGTK
jgi:hypothetical protein